MKRVGCVVKGVGCVLAVAAVLLGGCGGSHDDFREAYVDRATYGDSFADAPPELTDEQIDEAIDRVCGDGGELDLDEADDIAMSLNDGEFGGVSALGSAIYDGVKAAGCP